MDEEFLKRFEDRKIALVGERKRCRHFYLQFRTRLNIQYYFAVGINAASNIPDLSLGEKSELVCMPFSERVIREQNMLLVLCCRHSSREQYDDMLFYKGFEWGEDYIDYLYIIHSYQHRARITLAERDMWIFGAGNNGRKLYSKYNSYYRIRGFISNFEEEKELEGLPVIRPAEILGQNNFFIVICSLSEEAISRQLLEMGLTGGENFGFADMLPKKLFIAMGTCQIIHTARVLYKNKAFSTQYNAGIYMDSLYQRCSLADNSRMKAYGGICDVVFYNITNAGATEQRCYTLIINKFYKDAKKFFMPFYYFSGQLMQTTITENSYTCEMKNLFLWLRGDKEINCMLEAGSSEEEIVDILSADTYWSREEVLNHFEKELKKIAVLDRFSSFPIKGFLEDNYKKTVLFDDGFHFCISLHLYLANEIAGRLGIETISDPKFIKEIEILQKSVMPVYPCVRAALEMEIEDSYKFYNLEKDEIEYLSFQEYVKRYISYVKGIQDIFAVSGTIFRY